MEPAFEASYRDFYREIELHWSWRREKQIIVSPLEFEMIESWRDADIPLAVILRAIDLFIEAKAKTKRKRNHLLTHVDGTVKKVLAEYQLLHVDQDGDSDLLAGKLAKLGKKLKRLGKTYTQAKPTFEAMASQLASIDTRSAVSFETIEDQLAQMDRELLDRMTAYLEDEDHRAIRSEAEELLAQEEDPAFFAKLIDDGIRFHFGMPRLTVLG